MSTWPTVRVGQSNADIVGHDQRALQAALDYIAGLGGGTVEIGPGVYTLWDSLHLRSGVHVRGVPYETVLRKCDGFSSPLTLDGDYGEEQFTVADASGFAVGQGVALWDANAGGFHVTVTRIIGSEGQTFTIAHPLLADLLVSRGAVAHRAFPVISGYHVRNCVLENLTIEGNAASNVTLTGCRGAGIFLYRAHSTQIRQCIVRDYNGDGISFQQSNDVIVEDCLCEGNTQLGIHPGSGSQRPVIRRCTSRRNGRIGLFLCWRVRHGTFEDNVIEENGFAGISIGHKDTDNVFRRNVVARNALWGIYFRQESEPMGGHRNRFIEHRIVDNGMPEKGAGVRIEAETHDLEFEHNFIGNTTSPGRQRVGISAAKGVYRIRLHGNRFENNLQGALHSEEGDATWLGEQV